MKNLYEELIAYSESDFYGFHMPGHKRNLNLTGCNLPYQIDITEIEGFDDLHHADGILKEAQERAARLYKADETNFLINGSTAGILGGIMGCTQKGDKILISRNCHKSAYHAIFLNELKPVYLYPKFYREMGWNGPIEEYDVEQALKQDPDIRAIMITSPTYDGVVSDVEGIARMAHRWGIPLIVDEAHGAHFGFHPYFPDNSNVLGADVVIHSLHKTLPALTQTALLHMNGKLADRNQIRQYLRMFQTSSPSYVLMASIVVCMEILWKNGEELFETYVAQLEETRKKLRGLRNLKIAEIERDNCMKCYGQYYNKQYYDKSKIVISVKDTDWDSRYLYETLLQKYHLQMEMAAGSYVLAMTSIGDTEEGFARLINALQEIDMRVKKVKGEKGRTDFSLPKLKQVYTSAQVGGIVKELNVPEVQIRMKDQKIREKAKCGLKMMSLDGDGCVGCVSTEYAYIYPPGIPIIVPGEEISCEVVRLLREYEVMGFTIEGLKEEKQVEVLING